MFATVAVASLMFLGSTAVQAAPVFVVEDFEDGNVNQYTNTGTVATVSSAHAHAGDFGLGLDGNGWIYRDDAGAQLSQGHTFSVWTRFNDATTGRAYVGFGASDLGTLSFVLAGNTGDIRFQENPNFTDFVELDASSQSFDADKWYRAEVVWGTDGWLTGNLYDSDGATLLNSVSSFSTMATSGGIGFRALNGSKSFDSFEILSFSPDDPVEPVWVPVPAAAFGGLALLGMLGVGQIVRRRFAA